MVRMLSTTAAIALFALTIQAAAAQDTVRECDFVYVTCARVESWSRSSGVVSHAHTLFFFFQPF